MEDLLERIKKIESLILGATTEGERIAAISAKKRVIKKYPEVEINKDSREYTLYTSDTWITNLLLRD